MVANVAAGDCTSRPGARIRSIFGSSASSPHRLRLIQCGPYDHSAEHRKEINMRRNLAWVLVVAFVVVALYIGNALASQASGFVATQVALKNGERAGLSLVSSNA